MGELRDLRGNQSSAQVVAYSRHNEHTICSSAL